MDHNNNRTRVKKIETNPIISGNYFDEPTKAREMAIISAGIIISTLSMIIYSAIMLKQGEGKCTIWTNGKRDNIKKNRPLTNLILTSVLIFFVSLCFLIVLISNYYKRQSDYNNNIKYFDEDGHAIKDKLYKSDIRKPEFYNYTLFACVMTIMFSFISIHNINASIVRPRVSDEYESNRAKPGSTCDTKPLKAYLIYGATCSCLTWYIACAGAGGLGLFKNDM